MKSFLSAIDALGRPFSNARLAALIPDRAFWETTDLICPLCHGPIEVLVTNTDNLAYAIVCKKCPQIPATTPDP